MCLSFGVLSIFSARVFPFYSYFLGYPYPFPMCFFLFFIYLFYHLFRSPYLTFSCCFITSHFLISFYNFKRKINIKNSALDNIRYKQLNLYSHVRRINLGRLPWKGLEWYPPGRRTKRRRRRRERPRNMWMQEVATKMRE